MSAGMQPEVAILGELPWRVPQGSDPWRRSDIAILDLVPWRIRDVAILGGSLVMESLGVDPWRLLKIVTLGDVSLLREIFTNAPTPRYHADDRREGDNLRCLTSRDSAAPLEC